MQLQIYKWGRGLILSKHIALLFVLCSLFLSTSFYSHSKDSKSVPKDVPKDIPKNAAIESSDVEEEEIITIKAEDSESDEKKGITILIGKKNRVEIERENKDYLYAYRATLYRNVETDELIKIEADGNVEMKEGEKIATCQHAVINEEEDWIEMTGSAKVVEKGTVTEADKITYYRKEGRLATEGNSRFKFKLKNKENKENKEKSEAKSGEKSDEKKESSEKK